MSLNATSLHYSGARTEDHCPPEEPSPDRKLQLSDDVTSVQRRSATASIPQAVSHVHDDSLGPQVDTTNELSPTGLPPQDLRTGQTGQATDRSVRLSSPHPLVANQTSPPLSGPTAAITFSSITRSNVADASTVHVSEQFDRNTRTHGDTPTEKKSALTGPKNHYLSAVYALEQSSPFVGSPLTSSDYFGDLAQSREIAPDRGKNVTEKRVDSTSRYPHHVAGCKVTSLLSTALEKVAAKLELEADQYSEHGDMGKMLAPRMHRSVSTSELPLDFGGAEFRSAEALHTTVRGKDVRGKPNDGSPELQRPRDSGAVTRSYRNSSKIVHGFGNNGCDVCPMKKLPAADSSEECLKLLPTIITWTHGGQNVYVTGSFNGWKNKIRLSRSTTDFTTVLDLPAGTTHLKFVVDGEWRCSEDLDLGKDAEGNEVNAVTIDEACVNEYELEQPDAASLTDSESLQPSKSGGQETRGTDGGRSVSADRRRSMRPGVNVVRRVHDVETPSSSPPGEYEFRLPKNLQNLDPMFNLADNPNAVSSEAPIGNTDISANMRKLPLGGLDSHRGWEGGSESDSLPPALPRHLEKVILNIPDPATQNHSTRGLVPSLNQLQHHHHHHHHRVEETMSAPGTADIDLSILPVPNHVVLNHLYACSIRDGVMAVASTVRYKRKYVTTVLYKPVLP